jgi:hypothetical protein
MCMGLHNDDTAPSVDHVVHLLTVESTYVDTSESNFLGQFKTALMSSDPATGTLQCTGSL